MPRKRKRSSQLSQNGPAVVGLQDLNNGSDPIETRIQAIRSQALSVGNEAPEAEPPTPEGETLTAANDSADLNAQLLELVGQLAANQQSSQPTGTQPDQSAQIAELKAQVEALTAHAEEVKAQAALSQQQSDEHSCDSRGCRSG